MQRRTYSKIRILKQVFIQQRPLIKTDDKSKGGGLGIFTGRDQRSIFGGFEFRNLYFLGTVTTAVFFGLSNGYCILKCFM